MICQSLNEKGVRMKDKLILMFIHMILRVQIREIVRTTIFLFSKLFFLIKSLLGIRCQCHVDKSPMCHM